MNRECIKPQAPTWLDNPLLPITVWLGVVGAAALWGFTPRSVEAQTPLWLTYMWSTVLAAGGIAASLGSLRDSNRVEAAGLSLLLAGLGLFALAEATTGLGPFQVVGFLALSGGCAIRLRVLRLARKGEREVAKALRGGH